LASSLTTWLLAAIESWLSVVVGGVAVFPDSLGGLVDPGGGHSQSALQKIGDVRGLRYSAVPGVSAQPLRAVAS
jgi:hypothetical protein